MLCLENGYFLSGEELEAILHHAFFKGAISHSMREYEANSCWIQINSDCKECIDGMIKAINDEWILEDWINA